jgi:release factor glutamine methyltransferase
VNDVTGTHESDGTIVWRDLWRDTERQVGNRSMARWICETASGADGAEFVEILDEPATERMVAHLDAMIARVLAGEPLQYVLGRWAFRHLEVMVDRRVLIPRPETELLVEHAIAAVRHTPRPLRIADLGTGSGVIGLSLAHELWHDAIEVWLTDASPDALDVARANTAGIGRAAAGVRIAEGSWYDALPAELQGTFDLVACNPPYIATDDPAVETIVVDHEPSMALFAPAGGLGHLERIVADAPRWLAPGGALLVEIGTTQGDAVSEMMRSAGMVDVVVHRDLAGHHRVVMGRRAVPAEPV